MCNAVTFRSNIADFWREAGDQLPFMAPIYYKRTPIYDKKRLAPAYFESA